MRPNLQAEAIRQKRTSSREKIIAVCEKAAIVSNHFDVGMTSMTLGFATIFVDMTSIKSVGELMIVVRTQLRHIAPRVKAGKSWRDFTAPKQNGNGYKSKDQKGGYYNG